MSRAAMMVSVVALLVLASSCSGGKRQVGSMGAAGSSPPSGTAGVGPGAGGDGAAGSGGAAGIGGGGGGGEMQPADATAPHTAASPDPSQLYQQAIQVALTPDELGTTHFTTDGSEPTEQSPAYASPIDVEQTTTLKFFTVDRAGNREATQTTIYRLDIVRLLLLQAGSQ